MLIQDENSGIYRFLLEYISILTNSRSHLILPLLRAFLSFLLDLLSDCVTFSIVYLQQWQFNA